MRSFVHIRCGDLCAPGNHICPAGCAPEELTNLLGPVAILPTDMNDSGSVIIGRSGSFAGGFVGAIWVKCWDTCRPALSSDVASLSTEHD